MSSLVRRLQIRTFKKARKPLIPVLHHDTGNVVAAYWPRRPGQLAYIATPTTVEDIFPTTKHERLQPLIDILVDMARKRKPATT